MELDKLDNGAQDASKWCPIWYKMKPKVVSASLIGGYVYLSFFVKAVYILLVSFTLSHFHKSSPILLQVLQPFRLALCWMCDSPRTRCAWRTAPIYVWHEQATIEWARRVISNLLAATVWGVVHLPLVLSHRIKVVLWPGCENCARYNLNKKNMRSVQFVAKRREFSCNLSAGVVLIVRFTTNRTYTKSNTHIHVARGATSSSFRGGAIFI